MARVNANTFIRTCKIEQSNNLAADLNSNIQSVVIARAFDL